MFKEIFFSPFKMIIIFYNSDPFRIPVLMWAVHEKLISMHIKTQFKQKVQCWKVGNSAHKNIGIKSACLALPSALMGLICCESCCCACAFCAPAVCPGPAACWAWACPVA